MKKSLLNSVRIILSLGLTFFLLYSLLENISLLQQGGNGKNLIVIILLESICIFLLPFLLPRQNNDRKKSQKQVREERDYDEKLKKKIVSIVKLNSEYKPAIIKKCRFCNFENPAKTEKCLNCGKTLY